MKAEPPTAPRRVQLRRKKGWRMPANTVNVARPGRWGNPFLVPKHGTAQECVDMFRELLNGNVCMAVDEDCIAAQLEFLSHNTIGDLAELAGKNLACWCKPDQPCHADVLLYAVNTVFGETT